jgi:hypothetical protein
LRTFRAAGGGGITTATPFANKNHKPSLYECQHDTSTRPASESQIATQLYESIGQIPQKFLESAPRRELLTAAACQNNELIC